MPMVADNRTRNLLILRAPAVDITRRGAEITRLEGFSDAVFAFAVALLVVRTTN